MPKFLRRSAIKGQYGVSVVERLVLRMGYKWIGGNAALDTGIDGEIEISDPETQQAKNLILRVQVKTRSELDADSSDSFRFTCSQDDLDYWMQGNAPVILVIVKIPEDEAWWISITDYFKDLSRRQTRQIVFQKGRDRLDQRAAIPLRELAQTVDDGIYFSPQVRDEDLISNLLQVTRLPTELWMAETEFRLPTEFHEALNEHQEYPPREWFLKDGRLYTPHNLRQPPWSAVCDVGTVESIEIAEWRDADSLEVQYGFVRLLNQCLRTRCGHLGLRWSNEQHCYYFKPTRNLKPREVTYRSLINETSREVFRRYAKKKAADETAYYRHCGFEGEFRRFGGQWYLQITPRYVFTTDGREPHPYREEYQAKIKAIEGSAAVRGLVIMFSELLRHDDAPLFQSPYPFLGFGELAQATVSVSIDDAEWSTGDELASKSSHEETPDGSLFEL
ncbi:MAG: DUF4365 domain-containing protein [Phycisphaerales bacterium]|nr:DUF4365 domain-containing protein [Phycisphaerales bacterium]